MHVAEKTKKEINTRACMQHMHVHATAVDEEEERVPKKKTLKRRYLVQSDYWAK